MSSQIGPVDNGLLASLPADVVGSLVSKVTPVALPVRQVLYRPDGPIESAYFVTSGMISLVANLEDGMQAEVGIIGREGMLGLSLIAGVETSFVEAVVQIAGSAVRMGARELRQEVDASPALRRMLLRHMEALQTQITQTAACNGRHGLAQRLARWLLMAHDRVNGDELQLTHDFLGTMLGAYRPSITVTARTLQRAGLINYGAGRITILNRAGLEAASCECYAAVQHRSDVILGRL